MGMNRYAETQLKTLPSPSEEPLRTVQLSRKAFQQHTGNMEMLTRTFEQLKPTLAEYMEHHEILSLTLNLDDDDFETVEAIPHGERAMWIDLWLENELSTKHLLKKIRDFQVCHVQRVSHGYGFADFLGEVERWVKDN